MKKLYIKFAYIVMLMLIILLVFPTSVFAQSHTLDSYQKNSMLELETEESYEHYGYVIDAYHVDIKVNENNSFDITETIDVYFYEKRHGIYRTIPLINVVERLDGTTNINKAKITNLDVNNTYTTSNEGNSYKINIGSKDKKITGAKQYKIHYNYKIGNDPMKKYDEFYLDIIGTDWDTCIGNVTFSIKMPKKFDESKLGFSYGPKGSTDSRKVSYSVEGKKIIGSFDGVLNPENALTVRLELPEGYFTVEDTSIRTTACLVFIIPIACLLFSLALWYLYGKDKPVVETVEYYPPEGLNSLEIGHFYKGKADNKDVVSLLIYLANKGYIRISQTEEKALFSWQNSFEFFKLKKYDGDNANEKTFLHGLFRNMSFPNKDTTPDNPHGTCKITDARVTKADLYNNFYKTIDGIVQNTNSRENQKKIFIPTWKKSLLILVAMAISFATIIAVPVLEYADLFMAIGCVYSLSFYIPFYAAIFLPKAPTWFRILWGGMTTLIFTITLMQSPLKEIFAQDPVFLIAFFLGIACIIGMICCIKIMSKRSAYGNEILGKIKGFKKFLETAEKERLETMVLQDPTYFYDMLPYVYVFGISDTWFEKFETIPMQAPDWYQSPNNFSVRNLGTFMNTTMKSAERVMTSYPSRSSRISGTSGKGS